MKTKELINILQKADPEGECHVRVHTENGIGTPFAVDKKEGYWDGPYLYIEDGKLHFSSLGNKIDLQIMDKDMWVERYPNTWEERIEFHFDNYLFEEDRDEKINRFKQEMQESAEEMKEIKERVRKYQEGEESDSFNDWIEKKREGYSGGAFS